MTIITDFAAGIIPDYSLFCNKHRKEGERDYEKNNYKAREVSYLNTKVRRFSYHKVKQLRILI